jgi:hypothetical protein
MQNNSTQQNIVHIYYPIHLLSRNHVEPEQSDSLHYLIGFSHATSSIIAATMNSKLVSPQQLQQYLHKLHKSPEHSALWLYSNSAPLLLGYLSTAATSRSNIQRKSEFLSNLTGTPNEKLFILQNSPNSLPIMLSAHSNVQIIFYSAANSSFFYRSAQQTEREKLKLMQNRAKEGEIEGIGKNHEAGIDITLRQINSATRLQQIIQENDQNSPAISSPTSVKSALLLFFSPLRYFGQFLLFLASISLLILDLQPFSGSKPLKELLTGLQQTYFRLFTVLKWPKLYEKHLKLSESSVNPQKIQQATQNYYSSVVQFVLDLLIGLVIFIVLRNYPAEIVYHAREFTNLLHLEVLKAQIMWLESGFPLGMKLNLDLTHIITLITVNFLEIWNYFVLNPLFTHQFTIISWSSWLSLLGASIFIAFCSDLLNFCLLHLVILHKLFLFLYGLSLEVAGSLWRFYGELRKSKLVNYNYNAKETNGNQRNSASYNYSNEKLIVATVAFTIILCLFPTLLVYYVFFSFFRLLITGSQAILWWILAFFNCFPFYSLLSWAKNSRNFPGAVHFTVINALSPANQPIFSEISAGKATRRSETVEIKPVQCENGAKFERQEHDAEDCEDFLRPAYKNIGEFTVEHVESSIIGGNEPSRASEYEIPSYFQLSGVSMPFGGLFHHYRVALNAIQHHYTPGRLLKSFLTGCEIGNSPNSPLKAAQGNWIGILNES